MDGRLFFDLLLFRSTGWFEKGMRKSKKICDFMWKHVIFPKFLAVEFALLGKRARQPIRAVLWHVGAAFRIKENVRVRWKKA